MNAKVLERTQARVERDIFLGLTSHSNDFLQFLGGKLSRLALNAGESPHCIRYMLKLRLEFGVQCLDTILHRLVQLLEALIDLRSQSLNTILYRLILLYLVLIELRGKGLNPLVYILIELLAALSDLRSVVCGHLRVELDQPVELTRAAVLLVVILIGKAALATHLLVLGIHP